MARFSPAMLSVTLADEVSAGGSLTPRRYTLTHSDATGALFLTIGIDYDRKALSAFQARSMADEVLAEWTEDDAGYALVLHCRAQGGLPIYGTARMRRRIFEGYMPLVLAAMRYGDREFLDAHPEFDDAPVSVQYHYRNKRRKDRAEWGRLGDYALRP